MPEIQELEAALLRPSHTRAPGVSVLESLPSGLHLGAMEEGQLIGTISAYRVDPGGAPSGRWLWLHGPFGACPAALIDAVEARADPGTTLWSEGPLPGMERSEEGVWVRRPPPPPVEPPEDVYTAQSIRVLEGVEAVRLRPGMYVGSSGPRGLSHLLWELVSNVLDEHLAGHASHLWVDHAPDGTWTVADDGRGIPVDLSPELVEAVFCRLHAGSVFDGHSPHVHVGLHGVGLSAVNALSELLVLTVERPSGTWEQIFRRGLPASPLQRLGDSHRRGTTVRFRPDRTIFEGQPLMMEIEARLVELAHLNPGLRIELSGRNLSRPDGLMGLARSLAEGPITDTLWVEGRHLEVGVRLAVVWASGAEAEASGPALGASGSTGAVAEAPGSEAEAPGSEAPGASGSRAEVQPEPSAPEDEVSGAEALEAGAGAPGAEGSGTGEVASEPGALTSGAAQDPSVVRMFANQLELVEGTPIAAARELLAGLGPCVVVGDVSLQAPHYYGRARDRLDNPEAGEAVRALLGQALSARGA